MIEIPYSQDTRMIERIAVIGDIHGCLDELVDLYSRLSYLSLDQIWTVGDLVDRGPDNSGVLDFIREKNIYSVRGNHDDSICTHYDKFLKTGILPKNTDKVNTIRQLNYSSFLSGRNDYLTQLQSLPPLHVIDDLNLVIVHGGLWPTLPLYKQPSNVIRAQLIHPSYPGKCRWWGIDALSHPDKVSEEDSRKEGYERWYRIYDAPEHVIYGHSVFAQPHIQRNEGAGISIGVDTGSCFGGSLTASIIDKNMNPFFISVKAKKVWYNKVSRSWWEK